MHRNQSTKDNFLSTKAIDNPPVKTNKSVSKFTAI